MPSASPFSIKLFLVDGTPDGLRIVEKSNWTGIGLVCTRSQYAAVRTRTEFPDDVAGERGGSSGARMPP